MLLRSIVESCTDTMTDSELKEVLDLVTSDIMVNRVQLKQRTSLRYAVEAIGISLGILRSKIFYANALQNVPLVFTSSYLTLSR